MSNEKNVERFPLTGRIGRLVKILATETEENTFIEILENASEYKLFRPEEKSAWWKNATERMAKELGTDNAVAIMKMCGSKCCGKGQRATAKRLHSQSNTMQEFLEIISRHDVNDGDLNYTLQNENMILAEYNKCFCKQVSNCKEPFENLIYCQCSVEFNKQFFSAAFEKEVSVEILQSIICGAKSCKFRISF